MGIRVNFDYKGFGGGYSLTHYGDSYIEGRDMSQVVGGVSLSGFGAQFQLQNDFFAGSGDKFRTNAWELSYGHFVVGSNILENDPDGEGAEKTDNVNMTGKVNLKGSWKYGQVYSAPLWIGTRFGNSIDRLGYSHPVVQDRQQNALHRWGARRDNAVAAPYYNDYSCFSKGFYTHFGFHNPYSFFKK
jgi:hypothetical protein